MTSSGVKISIEIQCVFFLFMSHNLIVHPYLDIIMFN